MTNTSPGLFTPLRPTEVTIGGAIRPISSTLRTVGDGTRPTPTSHAAASVYPASLAADCQHEPEFGRAIEPLHPKPPPHSARQRHHHARCGSGDPRHRGHIHRMRPTVLRQMEQGIAA